MKKILLLSDTHGIMDVFIKKQLDLADEVWHAGDIGSGDIFERLLALKKPLRAVFGNIDGQKIRTELPQTLEFSSEGKKILMTHIGGYPGKYPTAISTLLDKIKPDIFICGHSHILKIIYDKSMNLLHINPGAAGYEGFHNVRTMIRFKLDHISGITEMEVLEKDKRK